MINRNKYYDRLRVLAMFLVIGVHAIGSIEQYANGTAQETVCNFLNKINNLGVPTFFALSGLFILSGEYDDIMMFYKKRIVRIGIPYLVYSFIYVCYFTGYEGQNIPGIPLAYVIDILTANVHPTHWFVYSIMGLYFAAPFLSRMVHAVSDWELSILTGGSFAVIVLCRVFQCLGMDFGIDNVVFNTGNLWMFIAGYSIHRLIRNNTTVIRYHLMLSVLFAIIYIITGEMIFGQITILSAIIEKENGRADDRKHIIDEVMGNVSRYSYSIYLIHAATLSMILRIYDNWEDFFVIKCFICYFEVFIISYCLVRIIDYMITDRLIRIALNQSDPTTPVSK